MLARLLLVVTVCAALASCQSCAPRAVEPDSGVPLPLHVPGRDAGRIMLLPTDAGWQYPARYPADPCPPETFTGYRARDGGPAEIPDGSVEVGLCITLHTLTGHALLNGQPVTSPVDLRFTGGQFESQALPAASATGDFQVRVMRSRFDILKYHPPGIFPTHSGYAELGVIDLTRDVSRVLEVNSHLLRGEVTLGTLPFTPTLQPPDVSLTAYGIPPVQAAAATSQAGSYELSLMEGAFGLTLSTPPQATFGTTLRDFPLTGAIQLDRDQEVDIALPARVVEATLTIDGQPLADRRVGPDFRLEFIRPGDRTASVLTSHEGGLPTVSALVPSGPYGVELFLERAPDRHLPSEVWNLPVSSYLDLSKNDGVLTAAWTTHAIEGALSIDGHPLLVNPSDSWTMYLYGFATSQDVSFGLSYEVPLDTSVFNLRVLDGNYFAIIAIDDHLAPDLVSGWYVVDKYLQVHQKRQLPINIETSTYSGRLLIDGQPPPLGAKAGRLFFQNRDVTHRYSLYYREVRCAADGTFQVRLPFGAYEVFFEIDRDTYPEYGAGGHTIFSRLVVRDAGVEADLRYDTVLVYGPLRVGGEAVKDTIGGEEVEMNFSRADGTGFRWGFEGGPPDYRLRLPRGLYTPEFILKQGAIDGVAWGNARLGFPIDVHNAIGPAAP